MYSDSPSGGRIALYVVGGLLGLFALVAAVWAISFGAGWVTAPWSGKLQARQQINSGDFRIAAYNHFFDLCASVQTADANIASQSQLLDQMPQRDSSDRERILTNIGGLESTRADGINQYNVDAAKSYTVGQFRSSNLPYQLPTAPYHKGEHISCIAS